MTFDPLLDDMNTEDAFDEDTFMSNEDTDSLDFVMLNATV